MTFLATTPQEFLTEIFPFNQLSSAAIAKLTDQVQPYRYRIGQAICVAHNAEGSVVREKLPAQVHIIWQGQARLLGFDPVTQNPITLKLLEAGEILGWASLVRGVACETAIASTEVVCLTLDATEFLTWLQQESSIQQSFEHQLALAELYDLLDITLRDRADGELILKTTGSRDLKELALKVFPETIVQTLHVQTLQSATQPPPLDPNRTWLVSSENDLEWSIGERFDPNQGFGQRPYNNLRLVGIPEKFFRTQGSAPHSDDHPADSNQPNLRSNDGIPFAPDEPRELDIVSHKSIKQYPYVRGRGNLESAIACFQMLSQYFNLPLRRDVVRRVLVNQRERMGSISLIHCGAVAELSGLKAQFVNVPVELLTRIQPPAIVPWHESFALIYEVSSKTIVMAVPEMGIVRRKPEEVAADFVADEADERSETPIDQPIDKPIDQPSAQTIPVLLLQPTRDTPRKKFGLNWFLPSLHKYRNVLIEVFIASFFVQLFGLANPFITQVIIDRVLVQNSPGTLQILGIFLVVIAIFEALLTSLRTYLFVDTTNRIDLALGSEIIDHLLRLPLRYFDRRPVGELATRVNELENIRQFLTGTALTVVLDALFSVIYIIVMFIYSGVLALVALATLPFFILLTAFVSPMVRRQLRTKAERNAEAQSHLVEVLSGIQTVKAQNIELRSRWKWQERYARYVSAGFKTVVTHTAASSTSTFLNQLSGLLVLWVGAFLVLDGKLTLGQLIAFRIIAGYVTSPLLRLTQLWQNFQETALSLERLSDILDTPMEADESNRDNIPLPTIEGAIKYEHVSFRFNPSGPLQLNNIHLEFTPGSFIGIVGQSGSGKSTLMKLLPRLYPLESGRILVDGYDISKVELYSLRRQIGIVPQDTLLFDGTIQENIALNHPDATSDEIINAARIAAAHDFVMELPNGYNTRVGERGAALSGGQRQRIAIARTVLQNPALLILDEATSALDYDAERRVCLNLAEAFKGRTVFFITHRLSTICNADRILLMDQGSVVEQGTHNELMAMKGRYYCLYVQQEAHQT